MFDRCDDMEWGGKCGSHFGSMGVIRRCENKENDGVKICVGFYSLYTSFNL